MFAAILAASSRHGLCPLLVCLLVLMAASQEPNEVIMTEGQPVEEPVAKARQGNALRLNAHTFAGNVRRVAGGMEHTEHWVISFCPSWWEPCKNLELPFDQMSVDWERKLNTALFVKTVRFAAVDCATDKVLCNEEQVEQYPTVHHYQNGKRLATWRGGRKDDAEKLAKFFGKRLLNISAPEPMPSAGDEEKGSVAAKGDRALDLLLVVFVLALNARLVLSNPRLWQKQAKEPFHAASLREDPAQRQAGEPSPGPVAAKEEQPAGPAAATEVAGVARFLPEEWVSARSSLEL